MEKDLDFSGHYCGPHRSDFFRDIPPSCHQYLIGLPDRTAGRVCASLLDPQKRPTQMRRVRTRTVRLEAMQAVELEPGFSAAASFGISASAAFPFGLRTETASYLLEPEFS
jgi:hypothetical protein